MASFNLGVVGCIAASASGGGNTPTGVVISQAASTGESPALAVEDATGNGIEVMQIEYSDFGGSAYNSSTQTILKNIQINDMTEYDDAEGIAENVVYAYLRATNATSYSWSASVHQSSLTYATASVSGAGATSQDATSSGIGVKLVFAGVGGRGGFVYAANLDTVTYKVVGTATNGDGNTTHTLYITYTFTTQ
jgi:hypothetical protein